MRILRPQEIPVYVADGLFDLGITGRDWIEERGADVVSLGRAAVLEGDRRTRSGSCWPSPSDSPVKTLADLAGQRVRGSAPSTPS